MTDPNKSDIMTVVVYVVRHISVYSGVTFVVLNKRSNFKFDCNIVTFYKDCLSSYVGFSSGAVHLKYYCLQQ